MSSYDSTLSAADFLRSRGFGPPRVAIVLGSGLGAYADQLDVVAEVPYREIPGFPTSSVVGHRGRLVFGHRQGVAVVAMDGRVHAYEGYDPADVVFPTRVLWQLGARTAIVTNAAGGIRVGFAPGDLMLITDHLNLTGRNPLVGHNDDRFGARFPDMTGAYDADLRATASRVAQSQGFSLQEGIYAGLLGPTYETPAEVRMLRTLGADAVGMSTVMEVIAWRHLGSDGHGERPRVLGISCITNIAAGMPGSVLSHEDVQEVAARSRARFCHLLDGVLASL